MADSPVAIGVGALQPLGLELEVVATGSNLEREEDRTGGKSSFLHVCVEGERGG